MRIRFISLFLGLTVVFTMACGLIGSLIGGGGNSGTVSTLWSDVPPMEGATPNKDLQLPTFAKLAIQAFSQGGLEFIAYVTPKTPQDVANFYTEERMKAQGWTAENGGCTAMTGNNSSGGSGGFCLFTKKDGDKDIGLFIFTAKDDKSNQTQLFYVRVTASPTPKP
jgi:hypothetical protein